MDHNKGKVLITGGFGFIGYHLAKALLERAYRVVVFGHRNTRTGRFFDELAGKHGDMLDMREGDILDDDLHMIVHGDRDLTGVFHLAAAKSTSASMEEEMMSIVDVNFALDGTVFDFCEAVMMHNRADAKAIHGYDGNTLKMVYMSTGEVYGASHTSGRAISENGLCLVDPMDPRYQYPVSKIAGEMGLRYGAWTFDWNIVRLQNPYGPLMDDNQLIPKIIREAISTGIEGKGVIDVATLDSRPFLYIDDVVRGLIDVYEKGQNRKTYNMAGESVDVGRIALMVSDRFSKGLMQINTKNKAGGTHRFMDTKRIKEDIGWEQTVPIAYGIQYMHEFYNKHDAVDRAMKNMGL